jgi:hypothetical protein
MFIESFEKTAAFNLSSALNTAKKVITNPDVKKTMINHALVGAGTGAITGAMGRDENGQRAGLGGAVKGALTGGAVGAASGFGKGLWDRHNAYKAALTKRQNISSARKNSNAPLG